MVTVKEKIREWHKTFITLVDKMPFIPEALTEKESYLLHKVHRMDSDQLADYFVDLSLIIHRAIDDMDINKILPQHRDEAISVREEGKKILTRIRHHV